MPFTFRKQLFIVLATTYLVSCVPDSNKVLTEVNVGHLSPEFREIIEYRHAGNLDSLALFLESEDPTQRYLSANALASLQIPSALPKLYSLLDDPVIKVRSVAAYAIGQHKNKLAQDALTSGFRQRDTMSVDNEANGSILHALGKISDLSIAEYISSADGYRVTDTLLIEGQMKAIYQFGLRGIHSPTIVQKAVDAIRNPNYSQPARLYAAHFLARTRDLDIEKVKFQIAEALVDESDPDVKMAIATSLRNTSDPEILTTLLSQLDLVQDYRVKCNILGTLKSYDHALVLPSILTSLRSENIHIARKAVDYVATNGTATDAPKYRDIAKDSINPIVKTALYEAIFKQLPYYYEKTKNATRWQVQQALTKTTNPYDIIGYLRALGQDPSSYGYLMKYADTLSLIHI